MGNNSFCSSVQLSLQCKRLISVQTSQSWIKPDIIQSLEMGKTSLKENMLPVSKTGVWRQSPKTVLAFLSFADPVQLNTARILTKSSNVWEIEGWWGNRRGKKKREESELHKWVKRDQEIKTETFHILLGEEEPTVNIAAQYACHRMRETWKTVDFLSFYIFFSPNIALETKRRKRKQMRKGEKSKIKRKKTKEKETG